MKKRILMTIALTITMTSINIGGSQAASSIYPYANHGDIKGHWAEEAILDTNGLGYMYGASKDRFNPNAQITYIEMYATLIRIMGLEEYSQSLNPDDWTEAILQVAKKEGLIDDEENGPRPRDKVTREEAAHLLAKALKTRLPLGNDISLVKRFDDYGKIRPELTPYIELVVQEGYMSGTTENLFKPKGYITRAEIAQIISSGKSKLVPIRFIREKHGVVEKKELGQLTIYNVDTSSDIINYTEKEENSFPVYINKNLYLPEALEKGDAISYYRNRDGRVLYAKKTNERESLVEGTLEEIDLENREITVLDFDNKKHKFKIDEFIDMDRFYFDQELIVSLRGNSVDKVTMIEEEDPERDGYIIPGSRFRVGKVLFASGEDIEIQSDRGREKFEIDSFSTKLYKKGKLVELFQLKEGDRVLLNFDDIYSSTVSEIKIEDEEKHIAGILRGKIELIDQRNKEILLEEPYQYKLGSWESMGDKKKIKLGTGQIYQGSKNISLSSLDKLKGQETYIAYEKNYGKDSVAKMTLKLGPAMEYKDKLEDIDYGTEKLVVNTNSFDFHAGTIVVKNDRLVDTLNLEKDQSLFLAADFKNGARGASFISIEGTSPIDYRVDDSRLLAFKGKIEDILDYRLQVRDEDHGLRDDFIFTEDTLVYDSQLGEQIPLKAFRDSSYIDLVDIKDKELRDRLEKGFYKNKMAYIVAREMGDTSQILGINIIEDKSSIHGQNIKLAYNSKGKIGEINQAAKTIQLKSTENYNGLTSSWENGKDEEIDLSKTIIILNDKAISPDEIYKIRANTNAYMIRGKKTSKAETYILIVED